MTPGTGGQIVKELDRGPALGGRKQTRRTDVPQRLVITLTSFGYLGLTTGGGTKPVPIIGDFAFIPVTWWLLVLLLAANCCFVVSRLPGSMRCRAGQRRASGGGARPSSSSSCWCHGRRSAAASDRALNVEIWWWDRTGPRPRRDYQGKA